MTIHHLILTGFAACSLLAAQANAQTLVAPAAPTKLAVQQAPALASTATTATTAMKLRVAARGMASTKGPSPVTTLVAAAGSMLVLADGIVAHAHTAQVLPPAAGFQYEH